MRNLILSAHLCLAIAVGWTLAALEVSAGARLLLLGCAVLPLLLFIPGLVAGRRNTLRWLAVALVLYAGLATVEVIATATLAAAAWLLFALLELALTLMAGRAAATQSRAATEES
jgi:uncharacterized membrane protein